MSQTATLSAPEGRQPWIHGPWTDSIFVLGPAFLATALVLAFPDFFRNSSEMKPWFWLLFIVGVDVAHVYSTLFRTYFDKEEFRKYRRPLLLIPVIAWGAGVLIYLIDGMVFWRLLAYLAVYHFIRQQYGFFSIYARKEKRPGWERWIDASAIYLATLYPIVYWHTHLPRNFFWFLPGDFISIPWPAFELIALSLYCLALTVYLGKEVYLLSQGRPFNWPKNLILVGTVFSWGVGIVLLNGDLAFTATNVLAHGIPYMALIWFYGQKKAKQNQVPSRGSKVRNRSFFRLEFIPVFVVVLFCFAYFEEGLWDAMVWRDHEGLFPWAAELPFLQDKRFLAIVVPLLAMPQITHYVIDGFIWRVRKPKSETEKAVFGGEANNSGK